MRRAFPSLSCGNALRCCAFVAASSAVARRLLPQHARRARLADAPPDGLIDDCVAHRCVPHRVVKPVALHGVRVFVDSAPSNLNAPMYPATVPAEYARA